MDSVNPDKSIPEDVIYTALLTGACGLDAEKNEADMQLINDYFIGSVKHLDMETYTNNPYYKNIRIPNVKFRNWELKYEKYQAYEAFVCNELILHDDFREIQQIGFFNEDFLYPSVMENGHEWMAIKPNEVETSNLAIKEAHGKVITFGLGLGYYPYMVLRKDNVESVTIIEKGKDVIEMFSKYILPQFEHPEKVTIINCDAFEYAEKKMPKMNYDYAFVDTWRDVSDGLDMYLKMKRLERLNPDTKFSYWVEESLLSGFRWQMFDAITSSAASYEEIEECLSDNGLRALATTKIITQK